MSYTLTIVILGTILLGSVAGALGCFAVLRKQSLLGDAIAHAALPGICIAFLITGAKHSTMLVLGAIIVGWLGAIILSIVTQQTTLKKDAILGIILSVFFGFGLVLLTYIQRLATSQKSGLNQYLFGSASTLLKADLWVMGVLGSIVVIMMILFWKEFKLISFDTAYASSLGYRVKTLETVLTMLIVVAIVIGLQTVGVVLMSALVIAPAVAARQWTDRLSVMVILAGFFGSISGVMGALLSSFFYQIPTGPVIVVVMSIIVIISLFLSPLRGIVWEKVRQYRNRKLIYQKKSLYQLWLLAQNHDDLTYAHSITTLEALGFHWALASLQQLVQKGLVYKNKQGHWGLTQQGVTEAQRVAVAWRGEELVKERPDYD
tara:strand:- start:1417 stop:2541 length:1125 start_codon:yes stop_codon:yes gene_type:complete